VSALLTSSEEHGDHLGAYTIFVLFLQLTLGLILKLVGSKTGIPYTLLITIMGIIMGIFAKDLGTVGEGIEEWSEMGAHDILLIFLPALIFESAFSVNWHIMKK
jgi:NhaP-type Na+/H+ or K+/H+ antiporter